MGNEISYPFEILSFGICPTLHKDLDEFEVNLPSLIPF